MLEKLKYYVARFIIFLIMVALITGMIGCNIPGRTVQYYVRISSNAGGAVTTPGQGFFRYAAGTVVNLVAEPDAGYQFVGWLGNADTIANVNTATTTVTINNNYFIIANFGS